MSGKVGDNLFRASGLIKTNATTYDDDAVRDDIATLALHQATDSNASKYNLVNTNVDQYEDSTGIASFTDCARNSDGEYVSSIIPMSTGSLTNFVAGNWDVGSLGSPTMGTGTADHAASPDEDGMAVTNASATTPITFPALSAFEITATHNPAGVHGVDMVLYKTSEEPADSPANVPDWKFGYSALNFGLVSLTDSFAWMMGTAYGNAYHGTGSGATAFVTTDSDFDFVDTQFTVTRDTDGVFRMYQGTTGGTLILTSTSTGGQDFSNTEEYALAFGGTGGQQADLTSFQYTPVTPATVNATGNYVSTATTANAAVTSMGAVITYKNQAGTNTLNTDIVMEVSADSGSNYTTCVLTAAGTFSTGILQAVANDVSVTSGTGIQYRISFANQADGSKEARIYGASLMY